MVDTDKAIDSTNTKDGGIYLSNALILDMSLEHLYLIIETHKLRIEEELSENITKVYPNEK